MPFRSWLACVLLPLVGTLGLGGCGDEAPTAPDTRALGADGSPQAEAPLTDGRGQVIPLPAALPRSSTAQLVRSGADSALAVWIQDGEVVAATYSQASGWSAPQPLEQIYGQASDVQLASNGRGSAIALWRHTVGRIESLRYSRYEAASGWAQPDVVPGALPRPRPPDAIPGVAAAGAPRLTMDREGNALARWPSGFDPQEEQTARYVAGHGWTRALSQPLATAPAAPAGSR